MADAAFAAQVRSLFVETQPATGPYSVGQEVMQKLLQQLPPDGAQFTWEIRRRHPDSFAHTNPLNLD